MKVALINEVKARFDDALRSGTYIPDFLLHSCIKNWKEVFQDGGSYTADYLNRALSNSSSGRLWGGEKYSVKSGLLLLAGASPDFFQFVFRDLLDEQKELNLRTGRFLFHCDTLLEEIRTKELRLNTHYQDHYAISLYLTLAYPERYILQLYLPFTKLCLEIGVQDIPLQTDLERYYKICRGVYNILSRDEKLMSLVRGLSNEMVYPWQQYQIVYYLLQYIETWKP